jgi:hypothetical protein
MPKWAHQQHPNGKQSDTIGQFIFHTVLWSVVSSFINGKENRSCLTLIAHRLAWGKFRLLSVTFGYFWFTFGSLSVQMESKPQCYEKWPKMARATIFAA